MPIAVKTIEAYRVERSNGEQRVFVQVNKDANWVLLGDCKIPDAVRKLYYQFPHQDPKARAWEGIEHNQIFQYVPKGQSKFFDLSASLKFFDPKLAESTSASGGRAQRSKRKAPESNSDLMQPVAKPSSPEKKKKEGKVLSKVPVPAGKPKATAKRPVCCYILFTVTHT